MQISLDNGLTFISANEAITAIIQADIWETVVAFMDDDIREQVHSELAPCSEEEFLTRYLDLSQKDLILP